MVKKVGKYEIGKTLGEGTFGKVKYAVNTETGEAVAIKVLDKEKIQKQNMGSQIKKEISIMKMVRNRYVVVLREVLASRTKIFIVLELITGGELFDKIVNEGRFSEDKARYYFRQLVEGVNYCHTQGVCHRDLKPENLLLDESGLLKISDFGLSALYNGGGDEDDASRATLLHTTCGTPNYVAPEVLADKGYDGRAADVWSIGVILYVLLAGFLPFDEPTMSALFRKIQKAEFNYPSWFSEDVRGLLDRILIADPTQRITLAEVAELEWYNAAGDAQYAPPPADLGETNIPVTPSQADMDGAIQEGAEEQSEERREDGPRSLNAFDLINMCGGLSINRMFHAGAERQARHAGHFTCPMPAASIIEITQQVLSDMGCETRTFENSLKIKASLQTPKGQIGAVVQLYVLGGTGTDDLHLVDVRRGKGDIMEFHKFDTQFRSRIDPLLQG